MMSKEFIRIAAQSAEKYHEWLNEQGKGLSIVQVDNIEPVGDKEIKLKCNKATSNNLRY